MRRILLVVGAVLAMAAPMAPAAFADGAGPPAAAAAASSSAQAYGRQGRQIGPLGGPPSSSSSAYGGAGAALGGLGPGGGGTLPFTGLDIGLLAAAALALLAVGIAIRRALRHSPDA